MLRQHCKRLEFREGIPNILTPPGGPMKYNEMSQQAFILRFQTIQTPKKRAGFIDTFLIFILTSKYFYMDAKIGHKHLYFQVLRLCHSTNINILWEHEETAPFPTEQKGKEECWEWIFIWQQACPGIRSWWHSWLLAAPSITNPKCSGSAALLTWGWLKQDDRVANCRKVGNLALVPLSCCPGRTLKSMLRFFLRGSKLTFREIQLLFSLIRTAALIHSGQTSHLEDYCRE